MSSKNHRNDIELWGIIGRPIGHSLSADYFRHKFATEGSLDSKDYRLFELERIEELPKLLAEHPTLRGLNVTIPYKEAIIPLLASISPEAERIGAVNCVRIAEGGGMVGYNTDYEGFGAALESLHLGHKPQVLILGTGGASKAVQTYLADHQYSFNTVSHSGQGKWSYEELTPQIVANHLLIVNTTPLGMSPEVDKCPPIPYEALTTEHTLFDLIYNPATTEFLRRGQMQGAMVCNGQRMFAAQAEASWRIFGRI